MLLLHLFWLTMACLGPVDDPWGPYRDEAKKWDSILRPEADT